MAATISAQQIKELRDRTGIGMGKCKEALMEADGDIEQAIENLRKKGLASAGKKADRETKEGVVAFARGESHVAIVEINSETDFVAKNDDFLAFANGLAEEVAATQPESVEAFMAQKYSKDSSLTIDEFRSVTIQKIGENLQVSRLEHFPLSGNNSFGLYSHLGGKLGTLVEIEGQAGLDDFAKDLGMHVAADAPEYLNEESVPADVIEKEKEIAREQMKGKPENIIDKIIEGKLNAFYDDNCFVRQQFIKDTSKKVQEVVAEKGKGLKVVRFLRWSVGE